MGSKTSIASTNTVSIPAVRRWAHRMAWRTQCLGAEAVALSLCEEGSEYVAECLEAWEGSDEWAAWDEDASRRGDPAGERGRRAGADVGAHVGLRKDLRPVVARRLTRTSARPGGRHS